MMPDFDVDSIDSAMVMRFGTYVITWRHYDTMSVLYYDVMT